MIAHITHCVDSSLYNTSGTKVFLLARSLHWFIRLVTDVGGSVGFAEKRGGEGGIRRLDVSQRDRNRIAVGHPTPAEASNLR